MNPHEDLLTAAGSRGHRQDVAWLIKQGVPVDGTGTGRRTALDLAMWAGHDDIVQQLLNAGADPEQRIGEHRETLPLLFAASRGHAQLALMLLEAGAAPRRTTR
ncbi:ankyrin repeat domain-containing protein [Streptomyces sp. NPDC060184]|uniref:ankyrin repeat domain-containing protein n=1 Tax=Streptomyces sp. NPDC060184 TaxID=3347064 RepID=UPI00365B5951